MSRLKRSYEDWWLWPVRETLGNLAFLLPLIIGFLISLLLPCIAYLRNH